MPKSSMEINKYIIWSTYAFYTTFLLGATYASVKKYEEVNSYYFAPRFTVIFRDTLFVGCITGFIALNVKILSEFNSTN
jgi:hypothetical protein